MDERPVSNGNVAGSNPAAPTRKLPPSAPRIVFLLGLLVCSALFWPNFNGGYLSDDFWWINDVRLGGPFGFWTVNSTEFFRPQSSVEFWLCDTILRGQPWLLHALTFSFFLGSALMVRRIVLQLWAFNPDGPDRANIRVHWAATIAGLIFAFYPSHSEPVNWLCCICDVAGLFEALLGLSLFLSCLSATGAKRRFSFVGAAFCMALSMTSKEVFLAFPGLFLLFAFLSPAPWRTKLKPTLAGSALYALLLAAYVFAHNVLNNHWGYAGQFKTGRITVVNNLTYDLPNAFLPFTKWISLVDDSLVLWPLTVLGIAVLALILHRVGSRASAQNSSLKPLNSLARFHRWCGPHKNALFLAWAVLNFYFGQFWEGDPVWALGFVCAAAAFAIASWRFRLYRYRLLVTVLFVASCISLIPRENLLLFEFAHLSGAFGVMKGKIAALFVLFYAYATRPVRSSLNREDRRWIAIIAAATCSALFLLIPAMDVSLVSPFGNGERLAYEASPFGAIALAGVLTFFLAAKPKLYALVSFALVALFGTGFFLSNQEWAYAGEVSRKVLPQLRQLAASHPRRIYLLSVPGFCGEAELFHNANDLLVRTILPGTTTRATAGDLETNHLPGDRVVLTKADFAQNEFALRVIPVRNSLRTVPNELDALGTGYFQHWFSSPQQGVLVLKGFKPGDVVAYVDGETVRVVK